MGIVWNCGSLMKGPHFCDSTSLKLWIIRLHTCLHTRYCQAPRHHPDVSAARKNAAQTASVSETLVSQWLLLFIYSFFSFPLKIRGSPFKGAILATSAKAVNLTIIVDFNPPLLRKLSLCSDPSWSKGPHWGPWYTLRCYSNCFPEKHEYKLTEWHQCLRRSARWNRKWSAFLFFKVLLNHLCLLLTLWIVSTGATDLQFCFLSRICFSFFLHKSQAWTFFFFNHYWTPSGWRHIIEAGHFVQTKVWQVRPKLRWG